MKKTVDYKGYQASVEFEDGSLFVKVLHIDDLLVAEVDAASEAQAALENLIEQYVADCAEEGRQPTQPFKGSFNVRLGPELHNRAARRAADEGLSLNKWICVSIEEKLECGKLSERIDGVFSRSTENFDVSAMIQFISRQREGYDVFPKAIRRDHRISHQWNTREDFDVVAAVSDYYVGDKATFHG